MASRSIQKALHVLGLFGLLLLVQKGNAFEFKVGGTSSWTVPPDSNTYNQWAERSRFQIGDSLRFVYSADKDSVLYVDKDDYTNCNTGNALMKFSDGLTVFKFDHSGPHYFISGVKDNCLKNEKLALVVMADRSNGSPPPSNETAASPTPSKETTAAPPPFNETAAAPPPPPSNETMTASPPLEVPPPPTGEESPSPPSVEINPTPAPSEQSTPSKNSASSTFKSFMAPLGAFLGSFLMIFF